MNTRPVLVTGASSGIGRAIAGEYARRGQPLVLVARDEARLATARAELARPGLDVTTIALDLAREGAREALASELAGGPAPSRVICAAGQLIPGEAEELGRDACRHLLEVNVLATAATTEACLPALVREGGSVLHLASMVALHPFTGLAPYTLSKWALRGYHESLVSALRAENKVRLAIAYPSIVATPMVDAFYGEGATPPPVYRAWPARDVHKVAARIVRRFERGRRRIFVSIDDAMTDRMLRWLPRLGPHIADTLTRWKAR